MLMEADMMKRSHHHLSRRRFISVSAASAAILLAEPAAASARHFTWRGVALGAEAQIQLIHDDEARARAILGACVREIDRLENKIRSLSELAVNRQEPEFISQQVDHVASSMLETERTMNDLQFATGLESVDEQTPELLGTKAVDVRS